MASCHRPIGQDECSGRRKPSEPDACLSSFELGGHSGPWNTPCGVESQFGPRCEEEARWVSPKADCIGSRLNFRCWSRNPDSDPAPSPCRLHVYLKHRRGPCVHREECGAGRHPLRGRTEGPLQHRASWRRRRPRMGACPILLASIWCIIIVGCLSCLWSQQRPLLEKMWRGGQMKDLRRAGRMIARSLFYPGTPSLTLDHRLYDSVQTTT